MPSPSPPPSEYKLRKWTAARVARGLPVTGTRVCNICEEEQPILHFQMWANNCVSYRCRSCQREYDLQRSTTPAARAYSQDSAYAWRARQLSDAHNQWWNYSSYRRKLGLPVLGSNDVSTVGLVWLYGPNCVYCGEALVFTGKAFSSPRRAHTDHIIPRHHPDSSHSFWNTLPCDFYCNARKKRKSLEQWLGEKRAAEIHQLIADNSHRFAEAARFAQ